MASATSQGKSGGIDAATNMRGLWIALGLLSIAFHLGLVFSGLVQALVARPIHMALALPWLFVFMARTKSQLVSGVVLMAAGEIACLYTAFNADALADQYGFLCR